VAEVTYFVALPFIATDDGIAAVEPTKCLKERAIGTVDYGDWLPFRIDAFSDGRKNYLWDGPNHRLAPTAGRS
jgi:hypothetical protein